MELDLNRLVGTQQQDNLITDITPPAVVVAVKLRKQASETVLKRGTVLSLTSGGTETGTAVILGTAAGASETLTPSFVLAEDTKVGTENHAMGVAYRSGCFSKQHITLADGYELSAADIDDLRVRDIVFRDYQP